LLSGFVCCSPVAVCYLFLAGLLGSQGCLLLSVHNFFQYNCCLLAVCWAAGFKAGWVPPSVQSTLLSVCSIAVCFVCLLSNLGCLLLPLTVCLSGSTTGLSVCLSAPSVCLLSGCLPPPSALAGFNLLSASMGLLNRSRFSSGCLPANCLPPCLSVHLSVCLLAVHHCLLGWLTVHRLLSTHWVVCLGLFTLSAWVAAVQELNNFTIFVGSAGFSTIPSTCHLRLLIACLHLSAPRLLCQFNLLLCWVVCCCSAVCLGWLSTPVCSVGLLLGSIGLSGLGCLAVWVTTAWLSGLGCSPPTSTGLLGSSATSVVSVCPPPDEREAAERR